jgi:hypothetical protein
MSIRRDLLMRTALLRLPDLVALRAAVAASTPEGGMLAGVIAHKVPSPRRAARRKAAPAKN